jgi:signal transduction histidine kinase
MRDISWNYLLDKLVIFACCLLLFILNTGASDVVPVVVCVTIAAINSYSENKYVKLAGIASYTLLSMLYPVFISFIPLIYYDLMLYELSWLWLFSFLPVIVNIDRITPTNSIAAALFICIAYLLKLRTTALLTLKSDYTKLRDGTKELSLRLESKNKELLDKQDYEINLATLNERNRISGEIHDSVGHILSSSILQIGAIMAAGSNGHSGENPAPPGEENNIRESLIVLKDTLSNGMDSIRKSIHNLHDESIDLYTEIKTLTGNFSFCPVKLNYSIETRPDIRITYCFIAIIKEALSNIMRHSNATNAIISLYQHPAIYQLIIQDNGTVTGYDPANIKGIGLVNIIDRINRLNGNINIKTAKGFEIFISVPIEGK